MTPVTVEYQNKLKKKCIEVSCCLLFCILLTLLVVMVVAAKCIVIQCSVEIDVAIYT